MEFALTADQGAMLDMVRSWVREELAPRMIAIDEGGKHPWDQQRSLGQMGVFGALFGEEWGGGGLDFLTYILLLEEVSYGCFNTGLAMSVHTMAGTAVQKFGTPEQHATWLPGLASGEQLIAFCLSEPDAGSDVAGMKCRADRDGDHYVLNGTKAWITFGGDAHVYLVYAVTDAAAPRGKGITAFLLPADTPGMEWGEDEKKMGGCGLANRQLHLTDCRIPASAVVGAPGAGFQIAMAGLNGGRIGIAATCTGVARRAIDEALKYAHERIAFGQPIAEFQGIQWKFADLATELEAARLLTYKAAWERSRGERGIRLASMAKRYATDAAFHITAEAVQLFGGYGYTREYPVERLLRYVKGAQIFEGSNEIQRTVIARELYRTVGEPEPILVTAEVA